MKMKLRFAKTAAMAVAIFMIVSMITVGAVSAHDGISTDNSDVYFCADRDVFTLSEDTYNNVSGALSLNTVGDVFIQDDPVAAGNKYLTICYQGSSNAKENPTTSDGSYTVWGEGGERIIEKNQPFVFYMKASSPDVLGDINLYLFQEGRTEGVFPLDASTVTVEGGTVAGLDGDFTKVSVNVSSAGGAPQGFKLVFDRTDNAGTVIIDKVLFNGGQVYDDFNDERKNPDARGSMLRTPGTINGPVAGANIAAANMWTCGTTDTFVVNDNGQNALRFNFNSASAAKSSFTLDRGAGSYTSSQYTGEIVITLRVDGISEIVMDGDSFLTINGQAVALAGTIGTEYVSIVLNAAYVGLQSPAEITSVGFDFSQTSLSGTVYVSDIYFPTDDSVPTTTTTTTTTTTQAPTTNPPTGTDAMSAGTAAGVMIIAGAAILFTVSQKKRTEA